MPSCAVSTCTNTKKNTNNEGIKVTFHRFPLNDEKRAILWFQKCQREDRKTLMPTRYDVICSQHFKESDFRRDLRSELLNLPLRRRLVDSAVPSINLPSLNTARHSLCLRPKAERLLPKSSLDQNGKRRRRRKRVCVLTPVEGEQTASEPAGDIPPPTGEIEDAIKEPVVTNESVVARIDEKKRIKNDIHCQILLRNMFLDESLMDVSLITQNKAIKAHRVVLRQASGYFKQVLSLDMTAECEVRFNDIEYEDLLKLIAFIYQGEVSVRIGDLNRFLKAAETLEIFSLLPWSSIVNESDEIKEETNEAEENFEFLPCDNLLTNMTSEDFIKEEESDFQSSPYTDALRQNYLTVEVTDSPHSHLNRLEGQPVSRYKDQTDPRCKDSKFRDPKYSPLKIKTNSPYTTKPTRKRKQNLRFINDFVQSPIT